MQFKEPIVAKTAWGTMTIVDSQTMVEYCILQLQDALERGRSANPERSRQELAAYREVLEAGDRMAQAFFEAKQSARIGGARFRSNFDVIRFLKKTGVWRPM